MIDIFQRVHEVRDRLIAKKTQYQSFIDRLAEVELIQKNLTEKHFKEVGLIALDTKVAEIVKVIFDDVSIDGRVYLENLINSCLQAVFLDENYKIEIRSSSRGPQRTAEFWLDDGKSVNPISECGDGLNAVVSFVIRIYTILKTKSRRIVIMDEPFCNLSHQYFDSLVEFLKELVKKFQFKFLWISHSLFLEEKHDIKTFRIKNGVLTGKKY